MSILIKGMEMPKSCWEDDCPCLDKQYGICRANADEGYIYSYIPSWCPLIELPPHGRLIDADALLEEIYKLRMWLLENNMPGAEHWVTKAYQVVDEMPTIIESEEN